MHPHAQLHPPLPLWAPEGGWLRRCSCTFRPPSPAVTQASHVPPLSHVDCGGEGLIGSGRVSSSLVASVLTDLTPSESCPQPPFFNGEEIHTT